MTDSSQAGVVTGGEDVVLSELQARLKSVIERSGELLPSQGPITGFAFLNPLQGLEHLPFEQGIMRGARLFDCEPYLPKDFYRDKLTTGRIVLEDLKAVLESELGAGVMTPIAPSGTRYDLRLAMLQYSLRSAPTEDLRWFIAETEALTTFSDETPIATRTRFVEMTRHWVMREVLSLPVDRHPQEHAEQRFVADLVERFGEPAIESWSDRTWEVFSLQALWHVCRDGVDVVEVPTKPLRHATRHRDLLLEFAGEDSDLLVHPILVRFCATFTDQGVSDWPLPDREQGLFQSFRSLYGGYGGQPHRWMRPLAIELDRIEAEQLTPLDSIQESLEILGVEPGDWTDFIESTVVALRGWAGMIWQMESRSDRVAKPVPPGSLVEFVAVRLLLDRIALRHLCDRASKPLKLPLAQLRTHIRGHLEKKYSVSVEQRSFYVFQLAQVMGWDPPLLYRLTARQWATLVAEIEAFPPLERRRAFQLAFEHRLLVKGLDAVWLRNQTPPPPPPPPRFQSVYCIDAREESFRRHLEEQSPEFQTFAAAGFFGVAMYFKGIADAHFSAQCPIVVRAKHWVVEDMAYPFEQTHQFRVRSRRALGIAVQQIHHDTRSFGSGAVLSAGLGTLASIPLVMRVLFPELTAKIRHAFGRLVAPPMATRLRLERTKENRGPTDGEVGFTIEEMAYLGERLLRDIGLTSNFARLVFFVGHGSACQNNPHKSTYDCGACTGNPGGPNGRALAAMLNHPKARAILASHGLNVPEDTIFVGALHNTCDDTIMFYDLDQLPKSHFEDFEAARNAFDIACRRNSHERCRRFYSAPLDATFDEAHRHVKDRSEDLAQTRPEFGNASNALCLVGRRSRSIGLFLDRRSFMQTYDPTQDDADYSILARILAAVIPVCSGINMQYNLSATDPGGWGSGTKLPHNITSLLGVMDGAESDLRCGLPIQSTEIHEPVRLLFIIETTTEGILKIMNDNPVIGRILGNGWAQLAVLDPDSNRIQVYQNGVFRLYEPTLRELPRAKSSLDWYRGWRNHLGFALIDPNATGN